MTAPLVHRNGTSKEELLDQITKASDALHCAYQAIQDAQPHMRDYYLLPSEVWIIAQQDHCTRLRTIAQVRKEYFDLAIAIVDQQG